MAEKKEVDTTTTVAQDLVHWDPSRLESGLQVERREERDGADVPTDCLQVGSDDTRAPACPEIHSSLE